MKNEKGPAVPVVSRGYKYLFKGVWTALGNAWSGAANWRGYRRWYFRVIVGAILGAVLSVLLSVMVAGPDAPNVVAPTLVDGGKWWEQKKLLRDSTVVCAIGRDYGNYAIELGIHHVYDFDRKSFDAKRMVFLYSRDLNQLAKRASYLLRRINVRFRFDYGDRRVTTIEDASFRDGRVELDMDEATLQHVDRAYDVIVEVLLESNVEGKGAGDSENSVSRFRLSLTGSSKALARMRACSRARLRESNLQPTLLPPVAWPAGVDLRSALPDRFRPKALAHTPIIFWPSSEVAIDDVGVY